jgi:hypothetical protein
LLITLLPSGLANTVKSLRLLTYLQFFPHLYELDEGRVTVVSKPPLPLRSVIQPPPPTKDSFPPLDKERFGRIIEAPDPLPHQADQRNMLPLMGRPWKQAEEKVETRVETTSLFHSAAPSAYSWGLDCLGGGKDLVTALPTLVQEMQRESVNALRGEIRMLQEQLQASEVFIHSFYLDPCLLWIRIFHLLFPAGSPAVPDLLHWAP